MQKRVFGSVQVSAIGLGSSEFGGACPESLGREFMDAYVAMGDGFFI